MSVVGFDFGNSKCVVAVARRRGIDVLQNEVGSRSTPSCVAFASRTRLMGTEALAQQMSNPKNTINNLKRLVGRLIDDATLSTELFNYKLVPSQHNAAYAAVEVAYDDKKEVFSPEQLTGALFQKLKGVAEGGLDGTKVMDCVISCPPWWNDAQRRALLDGANVAGLNVLRLLNETSAIALNYGILNSRLPKDKESRVLFIDMGHASTNVALMAFTEGKLQVLGTVSDPHLGGRDFDNCLVAYFSKMIQDKYKMDVTQDVKAMLKLRKECERVKLHLSANVKVQFNVEYIMNDRDVSGEIDRPQFEALASESLLPRLTALVDRLLNRLKVAKNDLYSIEVVGGAVRIPAVQKGLVDYFGRDLSKTCDGDESVARGCALMCAMISPSFKVKEFEVHDATPYAIALEWGALTEAGVNMKPDDSTALFAVNNPVPSVKLISFNNRSEAFQVVARYSDESSLPSGTLPVLGRFIVSGMPKKAGNKIKLRAKMNLHGCLAITGAQLIEEVEDAAMSDAPKATSPAPAAASPAAAPAANGEEKMDTSEAGTEPTKEAKEAAAAATAVKRKVNKTDLLIDSQYTGGLSQTFMTMYFEREAAMCNQDRVIFETLQSKNDLESYVLEMRNKLGDELAAFASDSEKERINALLTENEDWLYGDGYDAQKSDYKKRLNELKSLADPVVARKFEHDHRGDYAGELKATIGHYQRLVSTTEDKYAHITPEERAKVATECQTVDEWLSNALGRCDRAPKTESPPVRVADIRSKREALDKMAAPIFNRAKPIPPKVEEKKEEPKPTSSTPPPASSATPPPAAEAAPMDTAA